MSKIKIDKTILKKIVRPKQKSHKGMNGRLLVVAGSPKYHGAALLCSTMASKIVDFVYVHTTLDNFDIIKKIRPKLSEFVYIDEKDLSRTIRESDAILIGPGVMPSKKTEKMVNDLIRNNSDKKYLLDAGALRVVKKELLNINCVITPHKQEFKSLFGVTETLENAIKVSKKYPAVIILKGKTDFVIQNGKVYYNNTGNVGMTKGGTGDVLAGLLVGLLAKSTPLNAAMQAVYINGLAGDRLYKKVGRFYCAGELIPEVQKILGDTN